MPGNCHRMRADLSPKRSSAAQLEITRLAVALFVAVLFLSAYSVSQTTREVDVAGNGNNCTGNGTCGALQYFDAVQVANGNCTTFNNNQTCALTIIEAGDSINWVYQDQSLALHSATSGTCTTTCTGDGNFGSQTFNTAGQHYQPPPFASAAVYPYFCIVHGATMLGKVIVQDYSVGITNSPLTQYKNVNAAFNGVLTGSPAASNPYGYSVNLACANQSSGSLNCAAPASATPTAGGQAVTVNASAPAAGDYTFQLQGVGGVNDPDNLVRNSGTATLHVIDLTLSTPANITVGPSSTSASSAFTATTAGTFPASSVNLSCGFAPAAPGASCSFTVGGVAGTSFSPTAGVHNLTVAVTTSNTPANGYTVTVNADPGGGLPPKATTFQLTVQDFSLSLTSSATASVPTNSNATFSGTISSLNNYAGTVGVSLQTCNAPPPLTCTTQNVPLTAGQTNAPFSVKVQSSQNGQFLLNVQGAGPLGAIHAAPVTVNVGDFSMGVPSANALTAAAGNPSNTTTFALVTSQVGFSVNVVLNCNGLPAGATCTFFPSANILATGTPQTVTMYVEAGTATAGTYGITIHGLGNGIPHDAGNASPNITLKVLAGGASADMQITSFTHSPEPVMVGGTVTFTSIAKNNGPNATSGVTLTFNADNGATIMSASANAAGYACTTGAPPVTCSGGATVLNSGFGVTFTVKARAPFSRFMTAGAQVSSSAADPTPANNTPAGQNANIRLRPLTHNGIPAKLP